jgi:subtilisin family serine protease
MSRRLAVILAALACANASLYAVAEASPGERLSATGPGTVVAVVDTGVDAGSPSLAGHLLPGADLVDVDLDADDLGGHGTAVAAVVAARCQRCTILPVRVLSPRGAAPWSRVAAGIVWAVDHGARVINVSIAGPGGSNELRAAIAHAAAHDVLVVAAAGNTGATRPAYPAAYRSVVGVGASDAGGVLHDWSARGRWVDLAAPGCARLPVAGRSSWACGTSFAAPVVAATAALARAREPRATAAEIAASLPGLVETRQASPALAVSRAGSLLRADTVGLGLGTTVAWFRCRQTCAQVGSGATYRVVADDAGSKLEARVVTAPFGGLSLAASAPLPVG